MSGTAQASASTMSSSARGLQHLILRRVWSALWRHLPILAVSSTVLTLGASIGLRLAGGSQLLLPILLALFAGPTTMALFNVVQGALVSDDTDLRTYLRGVRHTALPSTAHSLIPALCLGSLTAAADVYARTSSAFMLVSLGTAIVATILSVAGFVVVLPLAVARPQVRGAMLWVTAWHIFGRWPVRFLAPIVMAGLALWGALTYSSTLVLLLPAPIALLAGAAYWCCAVELGARDVLVPGGATDGPAA